MSTKPIKRVTPPVYNFKVYKRKIDVYVKWDCDGNYHYMCSSNAYRTCRDARQGVALAYDLPLDRIKATFIK